MKRKRGVEIGILLGSGLLAALALMTFPVATEAFVNCGQDQTTLCNNANSTSATDCDQDGFTDYEECTGLVAGSNGSFLSFNGYNNRTIVSNNPEYLDPKLRDVFVVLNRFQPTSTTDTRSSLIPSGSLSSLLSSYASQSGLNVRVHEIQEPAGATDREVVYRDSSGTYQKALRLTESLDASSDYGSGNWGTPNAQDKATVWTQMIKDRIDRECANYTANNCVDTVGGVGPAAVTENYIKYVLSHEAAHMNKLTRDSVASYGGNHYQSSTRGTIMEQGVVSGSSQGKWRFYIPTTFRSTNSTSDFSDAKLNGT